MPKILELTKLDEECPECDSGLVKITEEWNPFPDEELASTIKFKSCSSCNYELVTEDKLFRPKNVPYIRSKREDYFIVGGVEDVYDAFDELEHSKECAPVIVGASSLDQAIKKGGKIIQEEIDRYRRKGGYMSKGMFIGKVTKVKDVNGKILYNHLCETVN